MPKSLNSAQNERIRKLANAFRDKHGLTVRGMAKIMGLSIAAVSRFLNDEHGTSYAAAERLASHTGVPLVELLSGKRQPYEPIRWGSRYDYQLAEPAARALCPQIPSHVFERLSNHASVDPPTIFTPELIAWFAQILYFEEKGSLPPLPESREGSGSLPAVPKRKKNAP